jgi:translation initiation factor IF-2
MHRLLCADHHCAIASRPTSDLCVACHGSRCVIARGPHVGAGGFGVGVDPRRAAGADAGRGPRGDHRGGERGRGAAPRLHARDAGGRRGGFAGRPGGPRAAPAPTIVVPRGRAAAGGGRGGWGGSGHYPGQRGGQPGLGPRPDRGSRRQQRRAGSAPPGGTCRGALSGCTRPAGQRRRPPGPSPGRGRRVGPRVQPRARRRGQEAPRQTPGAAARRRRRRRSRNPPP